MGVPSMKKFLLVLLVVMTAICLAACGGSSNTSNPTGSSAQSEPSAGGSSSASKRVSIQEEVIFDQNDIKVTAKSLDPTGSIFGATVAVLIENNSSKNITVQARNSAVNGVMVDTLFSCDVTAGKKANDAITFSASDLKRAGIEVIKEIQFQLHFFNAESWDTIVDSDPIIITTDADPSFVQEYDDSGVVLLDTKGFRIVATTPHRNSYMLPDYPVGEQKIAVCIGTELSGLSDTIMNEADDFLMIPMYGFTESFNLSVSAAIILSNLTEKLRKSSCPWKLSRDEYTELKLQWFTSTIKRGDLLVKHFYDSMNES